MNEPTKTTTTKKDLIDRIAEETNQKRTVVKMTVQVFSTTSSRSSGTVDVWSSAISVSSRFENGLPESHRTRTLERVPVPAKKTVKFKIGRLMREARYSRDRVIPTISPPQFHQPAEFVPWLSFCPQLAKVRPGRVWSRPPCITSINSSGRKLQLDARNGEEQGVYCNASSRSIGQSREQNSRT